MQRMAELEASLIPRKHGQSYTTEDIAFGPTDKKGAYAGLRAYGKGGAAKKPAAKKTTAKKSAAKKPVAKKPVTKKVVAKKKPATKK